MCLRKIRFFTVLLILGLLITCYIRINAAATYSQASISGIPGGGNARNDMNHGNAKGTNGTYASFGQATMSAWLGNDGQIVNSYGSPASKYVQLSSEASRYDSAENSLAKPNNWYYMQARSVGYEWGNNNTVRCRFSADKFIF